MRPFLLKAHTKPITWLQYNTEGDLLFVSSKDQTATVWYTDNGEILGSFKTSGAVAQLDVTRDSNRMLTADTTGTVTIWSVQNGESIMNYQHAQPIKAVRLAEGDKQFMTLTASMMGGSSILAYNIPEDALTDDSYSHEGKKPMAPIFKITPQAKVSCAAWGPLNQTIICGTEDGKILCFDTETQQLKGSVEEHRKSISKIQFSADKGSFVTASHDNTAKLFETRTLELIKTYKHTEPVNTAAISPLKYHIAVGGGTSAVDVTTSKARGSSFDSYFYHTVFEDYVGKIKGHFGPVHHIQFSPDGKGFASGGEDGIVRLHKLDKEYLKVRDTP